MAKTGRGLTPPPGRPQTTASSATGKPSMAATIIAMAVASPLNIPDLLLFGFHGEKVDGVAIPGMRHPVAVALQNDMMRVSSASRRRATAGGRALPTPSIRASVPTPLLGR